MQDIESTFEQILDGAPEATVEKAEKPKAKKSPGAESNTDSMHETLKKAIERINFLEKKLEEKVEADSGNPANEWAKKLAQEKANRQPKPSKTIYTNKDGKILKIDVKKNGSYSSYIGNAKKHKDLITPLIIQWKKEQVWVDEYELDEKIKSIMEELES